jgi:hypothetical protein
VLEDFQIVARRARDRFGQRSWDNMTVQEQARAIYEELRGLDAERFAAPTREQQPEPEETK